MARKRRDALRSKLDRLAEKIADEALTEQDGDGKPLTFSQKTNALKIAGAFWVASRGKDSKSGTEGDAWAEYSGRILRNGHDDAAEDSA